MDFIHMPFCGSHFQCPSATPLKEILLNFLCSIYQALTKKNSHHFLISFLLSLLSSLFIYLQIYSILRSGGMLHGHKCTSKELYCFPFWSFVFWTQVFPLLYQNLTLVLTCPLHVSFYFFFGFVVWPLNLDTLAPKIGALK